MTIQDAYNKGLDASEEVAIVKFSNALIGTDDGPFNNPRMEDIRQRILTMGATAPNSGNYAIDVLLGHAYNTDNLDPVDYTTIELLEYIKSLSETNSVNKITVKIKQFISKLALDLYTHID